MTRLTRLAAGAEYYGVPPYIISLNGTLLISKRTWVSFLNPQSDRGVETGTGRNGFIIKCASKISLGRD